MGKIKSDKTVDTSGHYCPVPIIETNRAMKMMSAGEILQVISTDTGSKMDIPAWCERTGNNLLKTEEQGKTFRYFIRKGG
jgi:tRNA 2-thiouridine synthesizing protein A